MKTKIILSSILILAFTFSLYACMESNTEGPESIADVESSEDSKEPEDLSAEPEESSAEPEVSKEVSIEEEDVYVQRELTEDMIKEIWRISGFSDYDPNHPGHVLLMSELKSNYYANHSISGYTLCHFDYGQSNAEEFEYLKDGYFFTTGSNGHPSHLSLYLYKDGKFITIEDALDSGLANAADLYEILSSDPKYGVKAKII